jgi:hypothetical protein
VGHFPIRVKVRLREVRVRELGRLYLGRLGLGLGSGRIDLRSGKLEDADDDVLLNKLQHRG